MNFQPPPPGTERDALCRAAAALDEAEAGAQPAAMTQALATLAAAYRRLAAFDVAESLLRQALRWNRAGAGTDDRVDLLCALCECAAELADLHEAEHRGSGHAARERARDHAFAAGVLAARVSDPRWEIQVLLRISDVLDRCGDRDDALALQTRALRLMAGSDGAPPADWATREVASPAD